MFKEMHKAHSLACLASAGIIKRLPDYWCKFCLEHRILMSWHFQSSENKSNKIKTQHVGTD